MPNMAGFRPNPAPTTLLHAQKAFVALATLFLRCSLYRSFSIKDHSQILHLTGAVKPLDKQSGYIEPIHSLFLQTLQLAPLSYSQQSAIWSSGRGNEVSDRSWEMPYSPFADFTCIPSLPFRPDKRSSTTREQSIKESSTTSCGHSFATLNFREQLLKLAVQSIPSLTKPKYY